MNEARRWLADLPEAAARRIAWENSAQLFGLPLAPPCAEADQGCAGTPQ